MNAVSGEELSNLSGRQGALKPGNHRPLVEQHDRGKGSDLELLGKRLFLFRIYFRQHKATGVLRRQLLQHRPECTAGSTPRGPEVHQNRRGVGAIDDTGQKI